MPNFIYASCLYPRARDAVAASLYDYATALGNDVSPDALLCLDEISIPGLIRAHEQGGSVLESNWSLPDYADAWDIERGYEDARKQILDAISEKNA